MTGKFNGKLIGYRTYDKDGKTTHMYDVFCGGKKDGTTGLYTTDCSIITVREDSQVIKNPKADMNVEFFGEMKQFKDKSYMVYSGIEAVQK